MVKKLFALASVTALTGLVVAVASTGCSSSSSTSDPAPATDAATDAPKPKPDSGEVDSGPQVCPIPGPVDTSVLPFKGPKTPVEGACTSDDLKAIEAAIEKNSNITLEQIKAAVGEPCKACGWGDDSGEKWAAIVEGVKAGSETRTVVNTGACMALVSGSDDCGKAFAEWSACLNFACNDCTDQASDDECSSAVQQDGAACNAQTKALSACGDDPNVHIKACGAFGDSLNVKYLLEVSLAALCTKSPVPNSCKTPTDTATSGVTGDKTIKETLPAERGMLCDWNAGRLGGYGCKTSCDGGVGVTVKADQAACKAAFKDTCEATVTEFEDCTKAMAANPCDLAVLKDNAACKKVFDADTCL